VRRVNTLQEEFIRVVTAYAKSHGATEVMIQKDIMTKMWDEIVPKETIKARMELRKYREKYGSDYVDDIEKARGGEDGFLFRIVEWDKTWLSIDWVQERNADAQASGDANFREELGKAVAHKPGMSVPRTQKRKDLLDKLQLFIDLFKVDLQNVDSFKGFHEALLDIEVIPKTEDGAGLQDFDYFMKYLRRHGLR
jgi:hypothetical protein